MLLVFLGWPFSARLITSLRLTFSFDTATTFSIRVYLAAFGMSWLEFKGFQKMHKPLLPDFVWRMNLVSGSILTGA